MIDEKRFEEELAQLCISQGIPHAVLLFRDDHAFRAVSYEASPIDGAMIDVISRVAVDAVVAAKHEVNAAMLGAETE